MCVAPGSSEEGSGEGGDGSGGEGGSEGGNSSASDGDSQSDDSDSSGGSTAGCNPGKTEKCTYQGPEGTEGVGPCKAGERTCGEDGKWGYCEGEVIPETESGDLCSNGIDDDCDGEVDNGADNVCKGGSSSEDDDEEDDSEHCDTVCSTLITADGCLPAMDSEYPNYCNGMDDDCDGTIDEGCPCNLGDTQACFSGKPAQRGVGTCHDGIQTCKVGPMKGVTGSWGECKDQILPKKDVCNNADDNCNGCKDEGLCCAPAINCDYDIGHATPFVDMEIDGTQIYDTDHKFNDADTVKWEWTLTKGPCDVVLKKTTFSLASAVDGVAGATADVNNGKEVTFSGIGLKKFKVNFQLSGTYNLHLKITREGDSESPYECDWPIKVVSTGLRVELCWDTYNKVDVDLHVGMDSKTTTWGSDDCYFLNCDDGDSPDWYPLTGTNHNPRLDLDNTGTGPKPENINIDNPKKGDSFKVGVYYWAYIYDEPTKPVVNIYCGGTRKATYGDSPEVLDFKQHKDFWKVVAIEWDDDDSSSDKCILTPKTDDDGKYVLERPRNTDYSVW